MYSLKVTSFLENLAPQLKNDLIYLKYPPGTGMISHQDEARYGSLLIVEPDDSRRYRRDKKTL